MQKLKIHHDTYSSSKMFHWEKVLKIVTRKSPWNFWMVILEFSKISVLKLVIKMFSIYIFPLLTLTFDSSSSWIENLANRIWLVFITCFCHWYTLSPKFNPIMEIKKVCTSLNKELFLMIISQSSLACSLNQLQSFCISLNCWNRQSHILLHLFDLETLLYPVKF